MAQQRYREGEYVCGVARQTSMTDTTPLAAEALFAVTAADVTTIAQEEIEDPAMTADGLARAAIGGVYYETAQPTFSTRIEGSRQDETVLTAPVETPFSRLVMGAAQAVASFTAATTVTGVAGNVITLTDARAIAANRIQLIAVETGNATNLWQVAPVYRADIAGAPLEVTTLMAVTAAAGSRVLADITLDWADSWTTQPVPLTIGFYGGVNYKNRKVYGAVLGMEVAAVGPNELPIASFTSRVSDADRSVAQTALAMPSVQRGRVFGCSELRLGVFGNVTAPRIPGRIGWSIGQGYSPWTNPNLCGVDGWTRDKGLGEIMLQIPRSLQPLDLGGTTATTWSEAKFDGEIFHLLVGYGQRTPGFMFNGYFPALVLTSTGEDTMDNTISRTLTLRPAADSSWLTKLAMGLF